MPHVSITAFKTTATGSDFTVTIDGTNSMGHPSLVWLMKSDFMFMSGLMVLPDVSGKWTAPFTHVPAGDYIYYAQCGQDSDQTGNLGGPVPRGTITPEREKEIIAKMAPPAGVTLADYYPRHIAAFGLGPKALKPLSFAGLVTASSIQPGPVTPVVAYIPGDGIPN